MPTTHYPAALQVRSTEIQQFPTPALLMDLSQVRAAYREMTGCFPNAGIHYAVKANPERRIVEALVHLGCRFDVASPSEIDLCLSAGARPRDLSYGNTIKKTADIAYAYSRGVRLFAFDCEAELHKLALAAPGSRVICRLATTSQGSCWPLARKFGCSAALAEALLLQSRDCGLLPWGIAFHVGSQQLDPRQWIEPIAQTGLLFQRLSRQGVSLGMVNLGGGFPAHYDLPVPALAQYATCIESALARHLASFAPEVVLEPGRALVADAGTLLTRVVLVSHRDPTGPPWVYLDIGKFGGLAETMDEAIRYRIRPVNSATPFGPAVLAGPTCDSADVLYERTPYQLPLDLREGDELEILSAGAYTSSYASVGFNGFAPLPVYFV